MLADRARASGRVLLVAAAALSLGVAETAEAQFNIFESAKETIGSLGTPSDVAHVLSEQEIADGLSEALKVATERVVARVGVIDGFNLDPNIHIPLPGTLAEAQKVLKGLGMAALADDLERRLNRAAEAAAPEAKALFWQAIAEMSLDDVRRIYEGPDDAATRYFEKRMSPTLAARMRPLVDDALAEVGAIRAYDAMMAQYRSVPFVPDLKADLTAYTVERAMAGVFYYVAEEEAAIRRDPAARTTALLRRVFGPG